MASRKILHFKIIDWSLVFCSKNKNIDWTIFFFVCANWFEIIVRN